jgi:hypothetical protein
MNAGDQEAPRYRAARFFSGCLIGLFLTFAAALILVMTALGDPPFDKGEDLPVIKHQYITIDAQGHKILEQFGPPDQVYYEPRGPREPKRRKVFRYHRANHDLIFNTVELSEDEIGWLFIGSFL